MASNLTDIDVALMENFERLIMSMLSTRHLVGQCRILEVKVNFAGCSDYFMSSKKALFSTGGHTKKRETTNPLAFKTSSLIHKNWHKIAPLYFEFTTMKRVKFLFSFLQIRAYFLLIMACLWLKLFYCRGSWDLFCSYLSRVFFEKS